MPATTWNGCSFLSVDPGLYNTGYAVYGIPLSGRQLILSHYGVISPPDSLDSVEDRISHIAAAILGLPIKTAFVILEKPPDTIYNQDEGSKHKSAHYLAVARATSIFKLSGLYHHLYQCFRARRQVIYPLLPTNWQERSKKQRKGLTVKEWSMQYANIILAQNSKAELAPTDRNENIADAIAMGHKTYYTTINQAD